MADPHGRKFMELINRVMHLEDDQKITKNTLDDKTMTLAKLCILNGIFNVANLMLLGYLWYIVTH